MTVSRDPLPGFKWPVKAGRLIAAPATRVWEVISSPGNLTQFHPYCRSNPVHVWPGRSSHDVVHYFNGLVLERRFTEWYESSGYDLEIGTVGGRTSVVTWRIEPIDEHASSISITVYPHALQHTPTVLRWLPHMIKIRPNLKVYLQSVVMGLEWFVANDQPVRRNQFGAHPWFSPSS